MLVKAKTYSLVTELSRGSGCALLVLLLMHCAGAGAQTRPPLFQQQIKITHPSVVGSGLSSITWDGRNIVAVGSRNTILRSEDGLAWQRQEAKAEICFQNVMAGNGSFLALTHCSITLVSRDGIQWDQRRSPGGMVRSAAFGHGLFVVVGDAGTIKVSSDATTWTNCGTTLPASLLCVRYAQDRFVAVGAHGAILGSPDGQQWTRRDSGTDRLLHGLAHGDDTWVAVGSHGAILSSPDGENWTPRESGTEESLQAVAFGGGVFLAVGWNGCLLASRDAREWRTLPSGEANFFDVAHAHGRFVAVGDRDTILLVGPNLPGRSPAVP